jgi:hypothetical protein
VVLGGEPLYREKGLQGKVAFGILLLPSPAAMTGPRGMQRAGQDMLPLLAAAITPSLQTHLCLQGRGPGHCSEHREYSLGALQEPAGIPQRQPQD